MVFIHKEDNNKNSLEKRIDGFNISKKIVNTIMLGVASFSFCKGVYDVASNELYTGAIEIILGAGIWYGITRNYIKKPKQKKSKEEDVFTFISNNFYHKDEE